MNKIFSDSLNDLERVLSNQGLENQAKFYVCFEFKQTDWENDAFGPYRDFAIFEEPSNKVTEFTIRNWIEQVKAKYTDSARNCEKVTILFFEEIS